MRIRERVHRLAHGVKLTFDSIAQALSIGLWLGFGRSRQLRMTTLTRVSALVVLAVLPTGASAASPAGLTTNEVNCGTGA
jgi:hypothetical protein